MQRADFIQPDGLILDFAADSKDALLRHLADRVAEARGVDAEQLFKKLAKREKLGSTGIGGGVALPHCPCPGVQTPAIVFARLKPAIDFQAVDGKKVDLVLMIILPTENPAQHLPVLSMAARVFRQEDAVKALRKTNDVDEISSIFSRALTAAVEEKRLES
ncbi:PTS sugar transporter subunit IIA [Falsirhodobacter sp. alg1]|uniref:PTS sugar transporter subunit IIA n=2 Tax=Falsirhodobacter sp. alg1 TaxID=1472418 RepID=UPI0005EE8733|nr:PTS sugar transporter subunit IIA [Falsirhodobacter sp. alg1]